MLLLLRYIPKAKHVLDYEILSSNAFTVSYGGKAVYIVLEKAIINLFITCKYSLNIVSGSFIDLKYLSA